MRTIHLWRNSDDGVLVTDFSAANPLLKLSCVQDEELSLVIHNLRRNRSLNAVRLFIEAPADYSTAAASIILKPDAPPAGGTFRLKVGTQITAALEWPTTFANDAAVTAWKLSVLNALKALSNIADSDIVAADPAGAVPHFLYFRWTDPERDDLIEVDSNQLLPPCEVKSYGSLSAAGFTQLLKLTQLPFARTTDFSQPNPPAVAIVETQPGGSGSNEEQVIIVPPTAQGSVAFRWGGTTTKSLGVSNASLTPAAIAAALNAIVPAGDTNPSFVVESRNSSSGLRFLVRFTGPLAGAPQAELAVVMSDQVPWPYSIGTLDLRNNLGIESALNGAPTVELVFELVLDGNERYLLPIEVANSATSPTVGDAIVAAGGITIVQTTVYLDEEDAEPFITAAAGLAYAVTIEAVGANAISVPHTAWENLITPVRVFTQTSADPEAWRECKDTEYGNGSSGTTHTVVTFPNNFVNDATSPFHYAKWKILLDDPDATVQLRAFKLAWDDCLATLPSGQTLTSKLAAIDAALGVIGGALNVAASNITGTLSSDQIDVSSLATSLVEQATFATSLGALYASNPTLVTQLITQMGGNASFVSTLISAVTNNPSITDAVATSLATNNTFTSGLQTLVLDVIQGTGNLPAGATLYTIPAVSLIVPPPQQIASASITRTVPATEQTTTTAGGTSSILTRTIEVTETTPGVAPRYAALTPQVTGLSDGSGVSGLLPRSGDPTVFLTVSGTAESRSSRGRRGRTFANGDVIVFTGGYWAKMVEIDGVWYPAELEQILFPELEVDASELYAGSRFSLTAPLFFQLLSATSAPATGSITIVAEQRDLATTTYAQIFAQTVHLSAIARLRSFGLTVTHAAGGGLVGAYKVQGQSTAFDPAANSLGIRFRATKGTVDGTSQPRGSVSITAPKGAILASTVAL